MKRYAIYLRKSRADEEAEKRGDEETLARHEKALLDLAKKKKFNIVQIYREVVSGETITSRPMVQNLLREVEQGLYDGVLVMEIERLARGDTIDQGIMARAFKISSTMIITPIKTYDPNNEFDEEYFEFSLFMSRREYKTINRRIQRGRLASVQEGKFISSTAPYGYIRVKIENDKGYTLSPHPEEADVVRTIFEWYTKGELQEDGTYTPIGMQLICKRLDSLKILPRKSGTWSRTTIRDILSNPVYIGKIRWQWRKEIKQSVDGNIVVIRPEQEEYILVDGLHEPIINDGTFNKAKKQMGRNKKHPVVSNKILKNPLSGIVKCGKCAATMTRLGPNQKNRYSVLFCPNKYCDNVLAPIDVIEDKILASLEDWVEHYSLDYKEEKNNSSISRSIQLKETSLSKLMDDKYKLKEQLEKTFDLLEQGIYSNDIFLERNKSISGRIESITRDIAILEKDLKEDRKREIEKEYLIPSIKNLLDIYNTIESPKIKNELLSSVIEKVVYLKTERNTRGKRELANFEITVFPRIPKSHT